MSHKSIFRVQRASENVTRSIKDAVKSREVTLYLPCRTMTHTNIRTRGRTVLFWSSMLCGSALFAFLDMHTAARNLQHYLYSMTDSQSVVHSSNRINDSMVESVYDTPSAHGRSFIPRNDSSIEILQTLPPVESLIQNRKIIGNVQPLFHFSVCGFAKTGTTSLMQTLSEHPEIRMQNTEWYRFFRNQALGVRDMYKMHERRGPGIMGYKNPHDIQYPSVLNFYRQHAPKTKLIVTVRHPVLWFESFYNYRVVNNELWSIKGEPNSLTTNTTFKANYVNAATGAFHRYLAHLGKTALDTDERMLLNGFLDHDELVDSPPLVPNPVLLLETRQLGDTNETRSVQLLQDIQSFLGFKEPLQPIQHANSLTAVKEKKRRRNKIPLLHICDNEYHIIKEEMMNVARNASTWIRTYFLKSPDVFVSSPDYFEHLMESWMQDPCQ